VAFLLEEKTRSECCMNSVLTPCIQHACIFGRSSSQKGSCCAEAEVQFNSRTSP